MRKSSVPSGLLLTISILTLVIILGFPGLLRARDATAFFPSSIPAGGLQEPTGALSSLADFSGVEMFLELTARLEKDLEPEQAEWDRLFATPGYAVLTKREFNRDFFIKRFRLAFMPSKKAELEGQLRKDTGFWAQFLPHYLRAKAMRREIEDRITELRAMDIHRSAVEKAGAYLPKGTASGTPRVAFVIFAPDARGYDPVVVDVLYSLDQRDRFLDFLAHEFHHWFQNRLVDLEQDQAALWVIGQVQSEGIADLIDKADWPKKPAAALNAEEKRYLDFYARSPDVIRTMDDIFVRLSGIRTGRGDLGEQLQAAVPMSGHPTGLYMATLIVEKLGKEAVVSVVGNPFAFFRLYNKAAEKGKGGAPRFSKKALDYLGFLEKRYME